MAGFFVKFSVLMVALVVVVSANNGWDNPCSASVTCPSSYMPGNFLTADPDNVCGYCQCVWGRPFKRACARYMGWNDMYKQCIPVPPTMGCDH